MRRILSSKKAWVFIMLLGVLFTFTGLMYPQKEVYKLKDGSPAPLIVVVDNAEIKKFSGDKGEVIGHAPFLSVYYRAGKKVVDGRVYYFAVEIGMSKSDIKIKKDIGWISEDYIITSKQSLRNEFGIIRKVIFVNGWNKDVSENGVNILMGPSSSYQSVATVGLFECQYLYKDAVEGDDGEDYYFIGSRPTVDNMSVVGNALSGWVRTGDIQLWDTRQAVQCNKNTIDQRKEGVKIFFDKWDLEDYLLDGCSKEAVFEEDMSDRKPWKYNWWRYPLLGTEDNVLRLEAGDFMKFDLTGDLVPAEGKWLNYKSLHEKVQVYGNGWATQNDPSTGKEQLETVLLVKKDEMGYLNVLLGAIVGRLPNEPEKAVKYIKSLWYVMLRMNVGELMLDLEGESIADMLRKVSGIPVRDKLLLLDLQEIATLSPEKLQEMYRELKISYAKLGAMLSENKISVRWDDSKDDIEIKNLGTEQIWFKMGGDYYGWIPLKDLP